MTEGQRSFAKSEQIYGAEFIQSPGSKGFEYFDIPLNLNLNLNLYPPFMTENASYWYAVHTRPRWEKKVAALLQDLGIINYCPLNKTVRQWSDRRKTVLEPLFKGYVFVQVTEAQKWELLTVNGIVNYVHWLGKPARIRNSEIDTIRRFLHEFDEVEVTEAGLHLHTAVRVKQGVLMNYKGIVLELLGNKARVKIESMGLQLSAVFDKKNLELVGG